MLERVTYCQPYHTSPIGVTSTAGVSDPNQVLEVRLKLDNVHVCFVRSCEPAKPVSLIAGYFITPGRHTTASAWSLDLGRSEVTVYDHAVTGTVKLEIKQVMYKASTQ
jgi:hypothetical protein